MYLQNVNKFIFIYSVKGLILVTIVIDDHAVYFKGVNCGRTTYQVVYYLIYM